MSCPLSHTSTLLTYYFGLNPSRKTNNFQLVFINFSRAIPLLFRLISVIILHLHVLRYLISNDIFASTSYWLMLVQSIRVKLCDKYEYGVVFVYSFRPIRQYTSVDGLFVCRIDRIDLWVLAIFLFAHFLVAECRNSNRSGTFHDNRRTYSRMRIEANSVHSMRIPQHSRTPETPFAVMFPVDLPRVMRHLVCMCVLL